MNKKIFYLDFWHDLYKSDIYSLGLVILEVLLVKQGIKQSNKINDILNNPGLALEYSKKCSINKQQDQKSERELDFKHENYKFWDAKVDIYCQMQLY